MVYIRFCHFKESVCHFYRLRRLPYNETIFEKIVPVSPDLQGLTTDVFTANIVRYDVIVDVSDVLPAYVVIYCARNINKDIQ